MHTCGCATVGSVAEKKHWLITELKKLIEIKHRCKYSENNPKSIYLNRISVISYKWHLERRKTEMKYWNYCVTKISQITFLGFFTESIWFGLFADISVHPHNAMLFHTSKNNDLLSLSQLLFSISNTKQRWNYGTLAPVQFTEQN